MARFSELTGGGAVFPFAAGDFTKASCNIIGFIPTDTCDVTGITYALPSREAKYTGMAYTGCHANVYYHFPSPVEAATFSVDVDLIFE